MVVGAGIYDKTVALNLLYGYPPLCQPRDHNQQNGRPKIIHHLDSDNKQYRQFPKTKIKNLKLSANVSLTKVSSGIVTSRRLNLFVQPPSSKKQCERHPLRLLV